MRSATIAPSDRGRPSAIGVAVLLALFTLLLGIAVSLHAQTYSVLYNFGSQIGDPYWPHHSGVVAQGRDGNLYSTAIGGGAYTYYGAVFKITPAGTLTILHSFDSAHGSYPYGGLTLATDGNFYGTTLQGGSSDVGTIFKITPSGSYTVLYNFTNGSDGSGPFAPPIQGTDGSFYGTASLGGTGCGTIYKLTSSGKLTPLYQFDTTHGCHPWAPLVQGTDGKFYGVTLEGGANNYGVVFRITAAGKLAVLYNFDAAHGANPIGPLIQGSDRSFYGTTAVGGTATSGVVFKVTLKGALTVLHDMSGTDGIYPYAGLLQATDGNFYGANLGGGTNGFGTIFTITPQGSYSVLYNFDSLTGQWPYVTPFQHTKGVVYGDTYAGGTGNVSPCAAGYCGVFYSLNAGLPAFVTLLPYSGKVGKTIEFLGQGFKGTTSVSFHGTPANFTVSSGTFLKATVPDGATTGLVTVTTSKGKLTSNKKFRVTPVILSFNPTSGPEGTPVVISGNSLTQTSKVTFGGVKATTFTVDNDEQVTATVPQGGKTGKIVITTAGGTATSPGVFTVTH